MNFFLFLYSRSKQNIAHGPKSAHVMFLYINFYWNTDTPPYVLSIAAFEL